MGFISTDLNIIDNLLNIYFVCARFVRKNGSTMGAAVELCVCRFQNILHELKIVGLIKMFLNSLYINICMMHFLVRML
jgi:hypothetical protein